MGKKFAEYSKFDLSEANKGSVEEKWDETRFSPRVWTEREGCPSSCFSEGPPRQRYAGIHHVMARSIKDIFCRYKNRAKGFQWAGGWDTHGLLWNWVWKKRSALPKKISVRLSPLPNIMPHAART